MKKVIAAVLLTLTLGGCAGTGTLATIEKVATATVPANVVVPAANTFDILKGTATNYGRYCIKQKMAPSICSADIRRKVIQAVRAGTAARKQLEGSLTRGEPALASVYNLLVAAVQGLQTTPVTDPMFAGGTQ